MTKTADGQGATTPRPKRKRILLAEGDGFTRLVLLFRLRLAGFQVDFTSNGILAMGKFRAGLPDALLVELKLGGLSGLELIRTARQDPAFGDRPICVYTYAEKMSRSARKEVRMLATKVFDKQLMTREEVVQAFAFLLNPPNSPGEVASAAPAAESANEEPEEMALPGALEEIIAGVREQSKAVTQCKDTEARGASCGELLSRVRSLASCAEAARLSELGRHAKALENLLNEICKAKRGCNDTALNTVTRAVEIMDHISRQPTGGAQSASQFSAVVVDEAPQSNIALTGALVNAGFEPISFEDPGCAREYLASSFTNLIIINVPLPEAHGLTLNEIRALPLHVDTPVIYVTAPPHPDHWTEQLPGSAGRLDRNPRLLTEVMMKALNEVQGAGMPPTGMALSPAPAPTTATAPAPASEASGDYFEMFAGPKRGQNGGTEPATPMPAAFAAPEAGWSAPQAEAAAEPPISLAESTTSEPGNGKANLFARRLQEAVGQNGSGPTELSQAPAAWPQALPEQQETGDGTTPPEAGVVGPQDSIETVFAPASAPAENLPQTEPGTNGGDFQAETWSILPESSTDGQQAEEQPLQMAPQPSLVQADAPEAAEPDLVVDSQTPTSETAVPEPGFMPGTAPTSAAPETTELAYGWAIPATTPAGAQSGAEHFVPPPLETEAGPNSFSRTPSGDEQPASTERAEADPAGQIAELEEQVRQSVAALARATADLATERGERQRSEQRTVTLTARLQELHEELGGTLQAHRESLERVGALEGQLRQTEEALTRRTADFEQQQAERQLAEAELRKAKEGNAHLRKDLAFLDEANKVLERMRHELESKLEATRTAALETENRFQGRFDDRQSQAEALSALQRELQNQTRKREALERELQTTADGLRETEARCQQESAERQRLKTALAAAELSLRNRSERSDLEFCKMESDLQLEQAERKRQERQLARARQAAADSLRAVRALRKSLRRQIREPVDNLYHSARHLLERELGEEEKKLAKAVLQDVLLVQTRLREPELPVTESDSTQTTLAAKPL